MTVKINENFLLLQNSYLFAEIARRVDEFQKENPEKESIDITEEKCWCVSQG